MFWDVATCVIVLTIFLHNISSEFLLRVLETKIREVRDQIDSQQYDVDQIHVLLQNLEAKIEPDEET